MGVRKNLVKLQSKTLGKVVPIPKRGSKADKLGWVIAIIGIIVIIYLFLTR